MRHVRYDFPLSNELAIGMAQTSSTPNECNRHARQRWRYLALIIFKRKTSREWRRVIRRHNRRGYRRGFRAIQRPDGAGELLTLARCAAHSRHPHQPWAFEYSTPPIE
jgi:hypothetical protein